MKETKVSGEIHCLTPNYTGNFLTWPGQWWEAASSQRQHLRPHGLSRYLKNKLINKEINQFNPKAAICLDTVLRTVLRAGSIKYNLGLAESQRFAVEVFSRADSAEQIALESSCTVLVQTIAQEKWGDLQEVDFIWKG